MKRQNEIRNRGELTLMEEILASHYKAPTKMVLVYCLNQWQAVQDGTALSERSIRKAMKDILQTK